MSGMTSERLEELRRIAQMATPGPWGRNGRIVYAPMHYGYRNGIEQTANKVTISVQKGRDCSAEEADAVALHIATFDPRTVLALLDEIERLRREREEDDDKWTRYEELYVQARGQIVDLQLEIERLRREREVLAEVLRHVYTCDHCECALCPQGTELSYRAYRALGEAMDLLDGEKIVGNVTRFVLYDPDLNWWECQACRFWWEFESGDPYDHDMRFCPRCGRWIMREA